MRADTHDGPEQNRSTSEAWYIDAALTFVDLGSPSCTARPGHTFWHIWSRSSVFRPLNGARVDLARYCVSAGGSGIQS